MIQKLKVEKDTLEDRFSQADQEKKHQINPESSQIDFFSAKEDRIQSIDCGTESSKCYKKLNESVKNNHKNEFSKYLEDSNERKDKRFKAEDPKLFQNPYSVSTILKFGTMKLKIPQILKNLQQTSQAQRTNQRPIFL